MDIVRRVSRYIPAARTPQLPSADNSKTRNKSRSAKLWSRLEFFRRPLRLKGNSSISVPLGIVILFPCIVVILILVLFVKHPNSPGRILMPAGAPPSIRYVLPSSSFVRNALTTS